MNNDFYFEDTNSDINLKKQERVARAAVELEKAKELANDSNKKIAIKTSRQTSYYKTISDAHMPKSDMFSLIEEIITCAKIPGMLLEIGGDALNNSIKNSVGDTHGEVLDPQNSVKLFTKILKEKAKEENIDLSQIIVAIRSGNHENRSYKDVAMDPAYMLATELGLQDRYAKNIAKIEIEVLDENNNSITKHVIVSTHGEQKPGKAGAQAESGLVSDLDYGADLVILEHNHKVMVASQTKEYRLASKSNPIQKQTTYVNFGAYIEGEEYSDRAGYTFPRKSDKEIVRISCVDNQKRYDLINLRSLINSSAEDRIKSFENSLKTLEKGSYKTENGIKKAYATLAKKQFNLELKKHENNETEKAEALKNSGLSDKLFFAPLSGLKIGNEDAKTNEIKQKINVLSKLNGSCKVALTDIIHYKKAFTLVNKNGGLLGEKFPEDTFSYIEQAAELLKPIKDQILAYNSGEDEDKIMRYQSEALAKMAMTRLQMPEKLCYQPYTKEELVAEQLKIQAKQVEAHNKAVLEKAVSNALRDVEKAIKEALPYKVEGYSNLTRDEKTAAFEKIMLAYKSKPSKQKKNNDDKNKNDDKKKESGNNPKIDYLKDIISARLRAEGDFLSLTEDKDFINFEYPLEDIELRKPHPNLIQHIFCAFLEIDPKKIIINANSKELSYATGKVKDDRGRTRTIEFFGGFSNSKAGRGSIDSKMKGILSSAPGAHVYYESTKIGKEFVLFEKQIYENPFTNKTEKKDTIFISSGSFSPEIPNSVNKIYKIFAVANKQEQEVSTGVYANAEEPFRVYCESLNYETALLDKDIMAEFLKNSIKRSFKKTVKTFKERCTNAFISKSLDNMDFLKDEDITEKPANKNENNPEMQ